MKKIKKALPIILSILLVIGAMPLSAFAVTLPASFTTVVDREMQLAPGITQNNVVVYDHLGRRQEFYVATADMNVSTVHMEANYPGHQLQHHRRISVSRSWKIRSRRLRRTIPSHTLSSQP